MVLSNWEFWWWYCWIESFGRDIVRLGDLVVVLSIESFGVVLSDSEVWLWYCQLGVLVVVLSNWEFRLWYCQIGSFGCGFVRSGVLTDNSELWLWYFQVTRSCDCSYVKL